MQENIELKPARVKSLSKNNSHSFSKQPTETLTLIAGEGVEGDAHRGKTVQHRSRVKLDPTKPNLRQVHLIHFELIDTLRQQGFMVDPASMGENITTEGLDILALPTNTTLQIGVTEIQITGLRTPCAQLDKFQKGLTAALLDKDENGKLIRKAGIMGIVTKGGRISVGDEITLTLPAPPHRPLEPV